VPIGQQALLGSDVYAPALALANFGTAPVIATVIESVTNANGPSGKTVATVSVAGQSSVTVPLGTLTGDSQMRNSFIVQSNSTHGALLAGMTVFGGTSVRSVQLPGKDWLRSYNSGTHPWTTAGGTDSTLLLFNYSNTPNNLLVMIGTGGVLWKRSYRLAALETRALDIGSLIATGAKDENGQILPKTATVGAVTWFSRSNGQAVGRLLVSQPGIGLARSFNCENVVTYCGTSSMENASVSIAAGATGSMGPYEVDLCNSQMPECGGGSLVGTAGGGADWTQNSGTSVAYLPSSEDLAAVTVVGTMAGLAQFTATAVLEQNYDIVDDEYYYCDAASQTSTANVSDDTPVITGLSQTSFTVGTPASFQINGAHFGTNKPQVTFSLGDTITVLSGYTDSSIPVSFTPGTAGTGTFTVTATGYGGQGFMGGSGDSPSGAPSPNATVNPKIQFVVGGPSFIFVGSDPNVIGANTFLTSDGNGGTSPKPSGGTLSATSSDSSDKATIITSPALGAQFTTSDQSTNSGDRKLTFKYSVNGGSASQSVNVTARKFAYVTNNSPANSCTLAYGTNRTYTYTVYTHPDGQAAGNGNISGTAVTESFSPGLTCGQHTGDGALDANGEFTDLVASACSANQAALTCRDSTTQTLSVGGFQVRTNKLVWSSSGIAYTSNGPSN
jgi:hypothetical protein